MQKPDMEETAFAQAFRQKALCLSGSLEVLPPNDMRNAKMNIIGKARYLVGRQSVATADDEIRHRKTLRRLNAPSHIGVIETQVLIAKFGWITTPVRREIAAGFATGKKQSRIAQVFQSIEIQGQSAVLRPVFLEIIASGCYAQTQTCMFRYVCRILQVIYSRPFVPV